MPISPPRPLSSGVPGFCPCLSRPGVLPSVVRASALDGVTIFCFASKSKKLSKDRCTKVSSCFSVGVAGRFPACCPAPLSPLSGVLLTVAGLFFFGNLPRTSFTVRKGWTAPAAASGCLPAVTSTAPSLATRSLPLLSLSLLFWLFSPVFSAPDLFPAPVLRATDLTFPNVRKWLSFSSVPG